MHTNLSNARSAAHSQPHHEIILSLSGSDVDYSFDSDLYTLRPGDLISFLPELYHSGYYHATGDTSERLVVQIDDGIWRAAQRYTGTAGVSELPHGTVVTADGVSRWDIRGLLERMAQSKQLDSAYRDAAFSAQTAELQLLIAAAKANAPAPPGAVNELVSRAVAYLQTHYQEPDLTASRLAQETFVSREHLSRAFQEYMMESIPSYLLNIHM